MRNLVPGSVRTLGLALCAAMIVAGFGVSAEPTDTTSTVSVADLERAASLQVLKDRQVGAVHPLARSASYLGALPADSRLSMTISFQPNRQEEIAGLLADLYNPASPSYHKWLTPEQWANRFGRSADEVAQAAAWLRSAGFTVDKVWENRLSISFSGSAATVQKAFNTQIGQFRHPREARTFFANLQRAQLPASLDAITVSLIGLNNADLRHHPDHSQARRISAEEVQTQLQAREHGGVRPNAQISGNNFVGPSDLPVIYGYQGLISGGVTSQGKSQSIGNIIDSDVLDSDVNGLRSTLGLPQEGQNGFQFIRDVPPGITSPGTKFEYEAELDIASIASVAPLTNIHLIIIDSLNGNSITLAENYAVNTLHLASVNESFGGCESSNFDSSEQTLFQQAAAAGTAFFASSGDEGSACSYGSGGEFYGVELPAAYGSVVAVGGTTLTATYNSTTHNITGVSSDVTWNTAPGVRNDCHNASTGGGATGGGIAQTVARPSYQTSYSQPGTAHGVPSGTTRAVPDVALIADPNGSTLIFQMNGSLYFGGGTSQASPMMAGMMTLINQYKGSIQGLPNSELYRQGALQYDAAGPTAFRDITSGNNNIAAISGCAAAHTGFSAAAGYDAVTGWGAPQIGVIAQNYGVVSSTPTIISATPAAGQVTLNWTTASGATSYNVYKGTSPGAEFTTPVLTGITGTSAVVTGLVDNQTYYFTVAGVTGGVVGTKSAEASATTPAPPALSITSAVAGTNQVTLTWTASTGAQHYNVYLGTTPGGENVNASVVNIAGTSTTVTGLASGQTYYFLVGAVSNGVVTKSTEASATPNPLNAPTNLTATPAAGQVTLNWTAPPGGVKYNVYMATTAGSEADPPVLSGVTGTSAVVTGLISSKTYYFKVAAVGDGGTAGVKSAEASATTPAATAPGITSTVPGAGQVTLTWSASSGAQHYNIYVGTSPGGESANASVVNVSGTSAAVTGLTANTTYYFKVGAVSNGVVTLSAEASAKTLAPGAPGITSAVGGTGQVTLTWSAGTGAQHYNVYVGTTSGGESANPTVANVFGSSATVTGLVGSKTYYFKVGAVSNGVLTLSAEASATTLAPSAPGITSTVPASNQVTVNWSASTGAQHYNIYVGTSPGGESTNASVVNVFGGSATVTGLVGSKTYYFKVGAVSNGVVTLSAEAKATTLAPTAPSITSAVAGSNQVTLTWTASSGVQHYNIYVGTNLGLESTNPSVVNIVGTTATVTGLIANQTYYFKVGAVSNGVVTLSAEAGATTASPPNPSITSAVAGSGQVTLTWTTSAGAQHYNIYVGESSGVISPNASVANILGTTAAVTGLTHGKTYYFQVGAVSNGTVAKSAQASATPS